MNVVRIIGLGLIVVGLIVFLATEGHNIYKILSKGVKLLLAYIASWVFLVILIIILFHADKKNSSRDILRSDLGLMTI